MHAIFRAVCQGGRFFFSSAEMVHLIGTIVTHSPQYTSPSPMIAPARRLSACFQPCVSTVERGCSRPPKSPSSGRAPAPNSKTVSRRHVLSNSLASSYEGDKNLKEGFSERWRSSIDLADDK
jgi:hypothetical protein